MTKRHGQKDKQWFIKNTHKAKDRVTLKTGGAPSIIQNCHSKIKPKLLAQNDPLCRFKHLMPGISCLFMQQYAQYMVGGTSFKTSFDVCH
jgi:hypothetical protein